MLGSAGSVGVWVGVGVGVEIGAGTVIGVQVGGVMPALWDGVVEGKEVAAVTGVEGVGEVGLGESLSEEGSITFGVAEAGTSEVESGSRNSR